MRRVAFLIMMSLPLAACGVGPGLTGNDTGGIIPYASVDPRTAQDMASAHCAQYHKYPKATAVDAQYGGYYSFACRIDRKYDPALARY